MSAELQRVSLLAGLPEAWGVSLSARLRQFEYSSVSVAEDPAAAEDAGSLRLASDWNDAHDGLVRLRQRGQQVETAVIGALAAPLTASLDESLPVLEAATARNLDAPMRLLNALMAEMLPRGSGRMLLVTWNPAACNEPRFAAVRSTCRAIMVYAESLRPALNLRGIKLSTLLLDPALPERWTQTAACEKVCQAAADFCQDLFRVRKLRV